MLASIVSVCRSDEKGTRKTPVQKGLFEVGQGFAGDAHAGINPLREVSLLALESIQRLNKEGFRFEPGDFAENLTTEGIDLVSLSLGTKLRIGKEVVLEITQIGKKCHTGCAIFKEAGKCIMPKEGVFARVVAGGTIEAGDAISRG